MHLRVSNLLDCSGRVVRETCSQANRGCLRHGIREHPVHRIIRLRLSSNIRSTDSAYDPSDVDVIVIVELRGAAKRLSHLPLAIASVIIGISGISPRRAGTARISDVILVANGVVVEPCSSSQCCAVGSSSRSFAKVLIINVFGHDTGRPGDCVRVAGGMLVRRAATAIGRNIGVTRGFIEGVFSREQALVIVVGIAGTLAQLVFFPAFIAISVIPDALITIVCVCDLGHQPSTAHRRASRIRGPVLRPAPDHTRKSLMRCYRSRWLAASSFARGPSKDLPCNRNNGCEDRCRPGPHPV